MNEPWRTFFDGYDDHWLLGRYLRGDEPDWYGIANDERFDCLSKGEKVLVDFAACLANVQAYLDDDHQYRIHLGLAKVLGS